MITMTALKHADTSPLRLPLDTFKDLWWTPAMGEPTVENLQNLLTRIYDAAVKTEIADTLTLRTVHAHWHEFMGTYSHLEYFGGRDTAPVALLNSVHSVVLNAQPPAYTLEPPALEALTACVHRLLAVAYITGNDVNVFNPTWRRVQEYFWSMYDHMPYGDKDVSMVFAADEPWGSKLSYLGQLHKVLTHPSKALKNSSVLDIPEEAIQEAFNGLYLGDLPRFPGLDSVTQDAKRHMLAYLLQMPMPPASPEMNYTKLWRRIHLRIVVAEKIIDSIRQG